MKLRKLDIEITTRCNLACVMCPHGLPTGYPGARDAEEDLVDRIIEFSEYVDIIQPTGVGEPLLASGFWKIVDFLRHKKTPKLMFITNGVLLTKASISRLSDVPISWVNVSVDAANPLTYARIRGSEMERTIGGIARLVEMNAKRAVDDRFEIQMSAVLMKANITEVPEFVRLAHGLGVDRIYLEHLAETYGVQKSWNVRRDGWDFNYHDNNLINERELSDRYVMEAMDLADSLGMTIGGNEILLIAENRDRHASRPCRLGTMAHS